LVLVLEIAVAAIAVALILLSLRTLQAIKHLGVGKSFWTPVAVSGFLFFFGSVVATLFEMSPSTFSLADYTGEVVQVSRLLALGILVVGVYSYSRRVTKNLGEKFPVPVRAVKADAQADEEEEEEAPISPEHDSTEPAYPEPTYPDVPAGPVEPPEESIPERIIQQSMETETTQECKYGFGHLRTLPKNAPIPDECYSCDKIIDCKHSQAKAVESPPPEQS
jgi:hypothetical protein